MRKTIIFACLLAIFLLMMIPNVNAIEYQNQKNIMNSEMETIEYSSFVKMMKQTPKNELRPILKNIIQIIIKVLRFIIVIVSTVVNIIKETASLLVSTVLHIIKSILSLLLFIILVVVFFFIVINVILIIILIIWAITSSLPQSYNISYQLEKLINSIKRTPN